MGDVCLSWALFAEGRARVLGVLRPMLGEMAARERATAIVQALLDGCGDPATIAKTRLQGLDAELRQRAAARVAGLWIELSYAIERAQTHPRTATVATRK